MKHEIIYLPRADRDIIRISEALINYPGKAKRLFLEIENKVKMLEDTPYMWPEYYAKPEYRRMVLEDHILFYIVDEDGRRVKIFRILYSRLDIPKYV